MAEGMIDVTGVDLVKLTQAAYELSRPLGLGFLHATPGPLPEEEARELVERSGAFGNVALDLDYVRGRAVKLTVWRDGDRLTMRDTWYHHSPQDLSDLLVAVQAVAAGPAPEKESQ